MKLLIVLALLSASLWAQTAKDTNALAGDVSKFVAARVSVDTTAPGWAEENHKIYVDTLRARVMAAALRLKGSGEEGLELYEISLQEPDAQGIATYRNMIRLLRAIALTLP